MDYAAAPFDGLWKQRERRFMRKAILELLRASRDKYISGEDIALKLDVSRTAVWKHIRELKNSGYKIESLPRSGYRLVETPDRLLPEIVAHGLDTSIIGSHIEYFDDVGSTNVEAKKLAAQGAADGTVVVSETQHSGQGRLDSQKHTDGGSGCNGGYAPIRSSGWYKMAERYPVPGEKAGGDFYGDECGN